jgi:dimethylhistidine N-methyltransferase
MKNLLLPSPMVSNGAPAAAGFLRDVLHGLSPPNKRLPCKYFYDAAGAALFERICELDEYYPTRCELAILRRHGRHIAAELGPGVALIEYGSGSSRKTRLLLDRLHQPAAYLPVDISGEQLRRTAHGLARSYPQLEICPVEADFSHTFVLPPLGAATRRVVYFSGSTIGNFEPPAARTLLAGIARLCGPEGGLLIGVDLKKDPCILHAAYNDGLGVTAAFNLNLLVRINRELGADFNVDRFAHYAFYNPLAGRIEMHLVSRLAQTVHLGGVTVPFRDGESICTEYSYKYSLADFAELAAEAGLAVRQVWLDDEKRFSVQYLSVAAS